MSVAETLGLDLPAASDTGWRALTRLGCEVTDLEETLVSAGLRLGATRDRVSVAERVLVAGWFEEIAARLDDVRDLVERAGFRVLDPAAYARWQQAASVVSPPAGAAVEVQDAESEPDPRGMAGPP